MAVYTPSRLSVDVASALKPVPIWAWVAEVAVIDSSLNALSTVPIPSVIAAGCLLREENAAGSSPNVPALTGSPSWNNNRARHTIPILPCTAACSTNRIGNTTSFQCIPIASWQTRGNRVLDLNDHASITIPVLPSSTSRDSNLGLNTTGSIPRVTRETRIVIWTSSPNTSATIVSIPGRTTYGCSQRSASISTPVCIRWTIDGWAAAAIACPGSWIAAWDCWIWWLRDDWWPYHDWRRIHWLR